MLSLTILAANLPAPLYPTPDEIFTPAIRIALYLAAGALLILLVNTVWPEDRNP